MKQSWTGKCTAAVLALLAATASVSAQTPSVSAATVPREEIAAPRLTLRTLAVDRARRDAARAALTPSVLSQPTQARTPGWAGRHPVLLGTLIGAGAGAALTLPGCVTCINSVIGVSAGVGAGAWLGSIVSVASRPNGPGVSRSAATATPTARADLARDTARALGQNARVEVMLRDGRTVRGSLRLVDDETFMVEPGGRAAASRLAYADVDRIQAHKGKTAVKAGVITGAVVLAVILGYLSTGNFSN